jgi:hypothetical protein
VAAAVVGHDAEALGQAGDDGAEVAVVGEAAVDEDERLAGPRPLVEQPDVVDSDVGHVWVS